MYSMVFAAALASCFACVSSRDHAHYKSVHCFLGRLKNWGNDFPGKFFANSLSAGYSRGLHYQMAMNERHIRAPSLQRYKNGNFNLAITLLIANISSSTFSHIDKNVIISIIAHFFKFKRL